MKLQYTINIRFLLLAVFIFGFSGVVFYIILGRVVHQNIDEMLRSRKVNIEKYIALHPFNSNYYLSPDNTLFTEPYTGSPLLRYSDTLIYDSVDKESVPFRKLTFTVHSGSNFLKIVLIQSLLESEDLREAIFYFLLGLFLFVVFALFVLNYKLSSAIWKPFYLTLNQLKTFNFTDTQEIHFPKSRTYEFDLLNDTLNSLTLKLHDDFVNLKEFTENASHEIQTPLSIIKSKLEMSLHDPLLPKNHRDFIYSAYESANRLSKLNEALLLLSKIENKQFIDSQPINFSKLATEKLKEVEELANLKNISITNTIRDPFNQDMNPYLAEILINNLFINAIRHNVVNGEIRVYCESRLFSVSNRGLPLKTSPDKLFKRFVKQNTGNESTGLGLAIVFEICQISGLILQYTYDQGMHTLVITHNS